ncbi:MAG: BamA/TamA family outer membrane protein [Archangium sp.]|nr:BamA/TamA family outer membrane protein [Archangium sp.]MDP3572617.1 BamA/TamA family outer membrane protein [Archangium sp.]
MGSFALLVCLLASPGVELKVTPVIAPAYTPELGFMVVAGGVAGWSASADAPRSSLAVVAGAGTVGAFLTQTRLTSFWMEDRVRLQAFIDVRDQPDHFFGVGFENGLTRPQGAESTAYRRTAWLVTPQLQVRMQEKLPLFFGTVMDFTGTRSRQLSPGVAADPDFQARGGASVINSGLGFSLTWDSRDEPVNPRKGLFLSAQWLGYGSWFGGTTQWQSLTLDYRHTVTLFREGSTLSWQVKYRTAWGGVPWSELSQLGTPWDLRAYRWGRYRDTTAAFALLEYRFMFPFPKDTIWARLGAAAWVGVGALGGGPLPDVTQPLPAVGVGLRVRVQDRVTVRLDFGLGRGSFAFYFQFLEAF